MGIHLSSDREIKPLNMGNWNSHPDQTVERIPPMPFQDDEVAEEYYNDAAWLNDYAWIYIVGGILIMFAILGCCYCLCTMGGEATPASANGYSAIGSPSAGPSAGLSAADQAMYAAIPTQMPKKSMKKQMSHAYPTLSPAQSVKGYSQGPPMYNQYGQPTMAYGYPHQPPPAQYAPYGGTGSFRAVPVEKVADVADTKPEETKE